MSVRWGSADESDVILGLSDEPDLPPISDHLAPLAAGALAQPALGADQQGNGHGTERTDVFTSNSIGDFVRNEQFFLDRPLVDQTGLAERYDFKLRYTYDEAHATDPNAPPGLFTAIQEQLGLKLVPVKAPVDVFVIDHVEEPSAN